jgi:hypothetical protein
VTRWIGFLELATLAALLFAAATSLATAALWPWLRAALRRWHPARAANAALGVALAPTLLPLAGLALCLAPGLLGSDHCPQHAEHAHLCLRHPALAQGAAAAALLAAAAAATPLALLLGAARLARARRALARLAPGARAQRGPGPHVLASEAPLSLAIGVLRPRIVVSRGLVAALAPAELAAVLEHERAHARRRDALRGLLARTLSWPHLPRVRRGLLAELRLATERACDELAAERAGDRLLVAEAILAVERLAGARPLAPALAESFGPSCVAPRVEALLAEPAHAGPARRAWLAAGAMAAAAVAGADALHHATEHLLRAALSIF